ncbi:MAG TPA: cytochrome P450 [Acidimicrobiales bacterium]|nr:cytochrome P450 [Acidimicrobiales bacterium]
MAPVPELGIWVATGHRHVTALLRDSRGLVAHLPAPAELGGGNPVLGTPLRRTLARMATLTDPPDHERARRPLHRGLGAELVAPWRDRARARAAQLLDRASARAAGVGRTGVEVVSEVAEPLLAEMLDEVFRLPPGTGNRVRSEWGVVAASVDRPEGGLAADAPARLLALHEGLALHLKQVRSDPRNTPVDVMVRTADDDPSRSDVGLTANLIHMLTSGHRSTAQALVLAVYALARHHRQLEGLRRQPALLPAAVEELLRWDGSVHLTRRILATDVTLDGHTLPAGSLVALVLAAANRDPEAFPSPATLSFDRPPGARRHVSFGSGPHFCVGAALARAVLHGALASLVERARWIEVTQPPEWTAPRRGLRRLEVRWW